MIENCAPPGRDRAQCADSLRRRHLSDACESLAQAFRPQGRVRVEKNILGAGIIEQRKDLLAKLALEFELHSLFMFRMCGAR